ncbi:hypothetical protein [Gemmatimonas sp.]|uniref:hypothetical protein n=1 Tax=Gemmatimonas sp. TaxID=1962908 RepID=UPI0039835C77
MHTGFSRSLGVFALVVTTVVALLGAAAATLSSSPTAVARRPRSFAPATRDPIARLQSQLDAGEVVLAHDSLLGYLPALLKTLHIPVSSQGLVFSRTSLQTDKITPWSPRAIYFNDDVYIGYVQESTFLEIAAVDPVRGAIFYTLSQEPRARVVFSRETTTCLMCHQSRSATGGVPGFMVISSIVDRHGYPIVGVHDGSTTDATPLRQRFGGWYVTGTAGAAAHAGNVYSPKLSHEVTDKQSYRSQIDMATESARTDLAGKFDPAPYLSAHSDVVALMVLVHQTVVHNLITAVHEAAPDAVFEDSMSRVKGRDTTSRGSSSGASARLRRDVSKLVRAMLFVGEASYNGTVKGTTTYAEDFVQAGPRDAQGRSLRDLDLETRLFKYPLSFLMYSDSFNALPDLAKGEIYRQLRAILTGTDPSAEFKHLQPSDRAAILEILEATKTDFPR